MITSIILFQLGPYIILGELLLIVGIISGVIIAGTIRNPLIGLLVLLLFLVSGIQEYLPKLPYVSPSVIMEIVLVGSWLVGLIFKKEELRFSGLQDLLLVAFILYNVISALILNESPFYSRRLVYKDLILNLMVYFLIINILKNRFALRWSLRTITLAGLALALTSFIQYFVTGPWRQTPAMVEYEGFKMFRITSAGLGTNELAIVVLIVAPLAVHLYRTEKSYLWKNLGLVTFPMLLLTNVLTFSRIGFVALIILVAFLLKENFSMKYCILFVASLLIIYLLLPEAYWHRIETITIDETGANRLYIYQAALGMFSDFPVFGVGYGNFANAFGYYQPLNFSTRYHSHNIYLQVLAETGILNFAIFATLLFWVFRNLKYTNNYATISRDQELQSMASALKIGIIVYLVGGFSLSILTLFIFYIYLGLVASLRNECLQN